MSREIRAHVSTFNYSEFISLAGPCCIRNICLMPKVNPLLKICLKSIADLPTSKEQIFRKNVLKIYDIFVYISYFFVKTKKSVMLKTRKLSVSKSL